MPKKVLLVIKSPPYGSLRATEGLRIATAMIAMDVLPQLLFIDDGVYCVIKDQRPETASLDSYHERLKTLADLVGLHAVKGSMVERKLEFADLDENFQLRIITLDEATELFIENETVITF
jgi:tRNA 2-thiouridine synthesizing protein C